MNFLQEVDRAELFRRHQNDKQLRYLCIGLCCRHCYQIELNQHEFKCLVINSSPTIRNPESPREYPTVESTLQEIEMNRAFLNYRIDGGGLSGTKIQEKIDEFIQGAPIEDCFVVDADSLLRGRTGEYYVIDGMHRLVAYGVWSGGDDSKFPITIYYCTDNEHSLT